MKRLEETELKNTIYVFNDLGAGSASVSMMISCLETFAPEFLVAEIDGITVQGGQWKDNAAMIVFGGGYDKGYMESVGLEGCQQIKYYIENGGRYLGVCAGAYFASGRCIFDKDGPYHIDEPRFIRAFPGNAVGPVYPGFEYKSEKGSVACPLKAETTVQRPSFCRTYFNGGCTFQLEHDDPVDVLYSYADKNLPAIIRCRLGRGVAVLSGAHFEFDPIIMEKWSNQPYTAKILPALLQYNAERKRLCRYLLSHLLLKKYL